MAYTLRLGTFAKKENSTAQPDITGWAEFSIVLKHGSNLINPEVTLTASESDVINYNYAYLFGSYYWIIDKTMDRNNLCTLTLEKDVLASYKTAIGQTNLYVLRASNASDGNILDSAYSTTGLIHYNRQYNDYYARLWYVFSTGYYIVNVLGGAPANQTATTGASTLWCLTVNQYRDLVNNLFTSIDGFQVTDLGPILLKLVGGQPEKLITSAMWVPGINFTRTAEQRIYIGTWDSGVNGRLITDPIARLSGQAIDIPKHPQSLSRGAYLNLAPYSTYTLTIPPFGSMNVDPNLLINSSKIYVYIQVDALTGQANAKVVTDLFDNGPLIANLTCQLGCPVPIQGQSSGASMVSSITSTIGGIALGALTGGAGAAAVGAAAAGATSSMAKNAAARTIVGAIEGGVTTGLQALTGSSCSIGSGGGALGLDYAMELTGTFSYITAEDNANIGRPYCQVTTPAQLGGFIMAAKAPLSISATIPEIEKIEAFITGGFYYE